VILLRATLTEPVNPAGTELFRRIYGFGSKLAPISDRIGGPARIKSSGARELPACVGRGGGRSGAGRSTRRPPGARVSPELARRRRSNGAWKRAGRKWPEMMAYLQAHAEEAPEGEAEAPPAAPRAALLCRRCPRTATTMTTTTPPGRL
jgi:hypothetical protein